MVYMYVYTMENGMEGTDGSFHSFKFLFGDKSGI